MALQVSPVLSFPGGCRKLIVFTGAFSLLFGSEVQHLKPQI